MSPNARALLIVLGLVAPPLTLPAGEPLHVRIDRIIDTQAEAESISLAPLAEDAEFLRRVWLDFAGTIPSAEVAKAFLADPNPEKRARMIDQLLSAPTYADRMAEAFHAMLMERLGDGGEWISYLKRSFQANKPWDVMVREILRADASNESAKGAAYFLAKRLDKYGQNPVEYAALTRDVGRLFLGKDLRCAECHDHLFIEDYKQRDFQALHTFFMNTARAGEYEVIEKPTTKKTSFTSVFTKVPMETGPGLPGMAMLDLPMFKPGEEYLQPPDPKSKKPGVPKFSLLEALARTLPTATNSDFTRNSVNRLWFLLMGRGIVHPLDLHHSHNPPSHPELLDLLAKEFASHGFDIKWLLREMALTRVYQRSSRLPSTANPPPENRFAVALERRLSSDQLLASVLTATGVKESESPGLRAKFHKAFDNQPREPEDEISPSLKSTLFILNDESLLNLFQPRPGSLVERSSRWPDAAVAEELYIAILTRKPTAEESAAVLKVLARYHGEDRTQAIGRIAWALAASMEFAVNH